MNHTPTDLTCLGTCNIDFISQVPHFAYSEEEVNVEKLHISLGGSAFNFASRISSLNVKTGILARVGKDYFGELFSGQLKALNIDCSRLVAIEDTTGMAYITITTSAEKSIYSFTGANASFKLEKGDIEFIKNSKMLHLTGMYWEVAEEASKHAEKLSFNPGPIMSSFGVEKLKNILKRTEILFLNQKEVSLLTGMEWEDGSFTLLDLGIPMVVVTNGAEGAKLFTEEGVIYSPAKKVRVVDTTGAGDNFAAGFIKSYIEGERHKDCLKNANKIASLCVQKMGGSVTGKIDF
jgi:ribokinase